MGRTQGVGVVLTQDPAHAGEGVFAELARLLILPRLPQGGGEGVGRAQGVGVVLAQDPTTAGESVLTQLAAPLTLPQLPRNAVKTPVEDKEETATARHGRHPMPASPPVSARVDPLGRVAHGLCDGPSLLTSRLVDLFDRRSGGSRGDQALPLS